METIEYVPVYTVKLVRETTFPMKIIEGNADVVELLEDYLKDKDREHFVCVHLNTKNKVIGIETVFIGTLNCTFCAPREIFRSAILDGSSSIILAHNHPSGDSSPSWEDISSTEKIMKIGNILDIPVLDHVIIASEGNYSMLRSGTLPMD